MQKTMKKRVTRHDRGKMIAARARKSLDELALYCLENALMVKVTGRFGEELDSVDPTLLEAIEKLKRFENDQGCSTCGRRWDSARDTCHVEGGWPEKCPDSAFGCEHWKIDKKKKTV
jgi:hypothetical protein